MLAFGVPLKYAEEAKHRLIELDIMDRAHKAAKKNGMLFFPVKTDNKQLLKEFKSSKFIDFDLKEKDKKKDYKSYLSGVLTDKEVESLPSSYDVIGGILILGLNDKKNEKKIAEAILKSNKNIKTVLKKSGIHEGEFRTQPLIYLAGERKKETTYKENNVRIKLDVEKVYFSPRLSTERKRIYQQVQKGEEILVMFSGCAPYPLVLSKNTEAKHITGIEKNPIAHRYALENLEQNKTKNITLFNGDVKEEIPKLKQKFDRILMPLPKGAEDFLYLAFSVAKKKAIIHFYDFEHESEFDNGEKKVLNAAIVSKKKVRILRTVKCGQYSPGKFRICVDFIVN